MTKTKEEIIAGIFKDRWYFNPSEFKHPELVNRDALLNLDMFRTFVSHPIIITDDARTDEENPSGSAGIRSLHKQGRAFDIRIRDWDPEKLFNAVKTLTFHWIRGMELELVWSNKDKHLHVGWYEDTTKLSRLFIRGD